jgi:Na+/proline symporter
VQKLSSRFPLIGGFGARTRPKNVIKARFGARTHLVFCTFAFFTNLIVMMSLTVAGTAVLNSLVADLSPELAAMLLAVVIGGYTLIGGLGATFYVSYFNTALIFFLIILLMVEVRVKYIDSIIFILFF